MSRQLDINGLVKSREGTGDKSEKEELSLAVTKGKPVVEAGDQSVQTGDKPKVELLVKTGDQAIEQPLVKAVDQSNEHLVQSGDQSNGEAMGSKTTVLVRTAVKPTEAVAKQGLDTGEGVRKHSLGSKTVEKPKSKAYLKATLSNDCLDRAGDKAKKDTELCAQLCSRTHKVYGVKNQVLLALIYYVCVCCVCPPNSLPPLLFPPTLPSTLPLHFSLPPNYLPPLSLPPNSPPPLSLLSYVCVCCVCVLVPLGSRMAGGGV